MNRISIDVLIAKSRAVTNSSKAIRDGSRALRRESLALIQQAKLYVMSGKIKLPPKPRKRASSDNQ